jgi:hypothetical protein
VEETAFWLLMQLAEEIVPEYWATQLEGLRADVSLLEELAAERLPRAHGRCACACAR